jgi:Holliday junction DNA helicase RuvA
MIGFLHGEIAHLGLQSVVINVQGVGYEVRVHDRLRIHLTEKLNTTVKLTTHLISKEDSMELYGFYSPQEKEIFLQLTRVSGIGPRTALAIFSMLDFTAIVRAIIGNQPDILSQAPGIGKKTAQRIILELKEKLTKIHAQTLPEATTEASQLPPDWQEDIELTLIALGYSAAEIQKGIHFAVEFVHNVDNVDEVLPLILAELSD